MEDPGQGRVLGMAGISGKESGKRNWKPSGGGGRRALPVPKELPARFSPSAVRNKRILNSQQWTNGKNYAIFYSRKLYAARLGR